MRSISSGWLAGLAVAVFMLSGLPASAQQSSSSSTSSQRPATLPPVISGFVECAKQGGICEFTGTRTVITDNCFEYSCWTSKKIATGPVGCYGYIASGVTRCSYSLQVIPPLGGLTAMASTQSGVGRNAAKAIDGANDTRWEASNSTAGSWLRVHSGAPFFLQKVEVVEHGNRIRGYRLEYLDGGVWVPLREGAALGTGVIYNNPSLSILTTAVRIVTTAASAGQPSIAELSVIGTPAAPQ